jgi:hypothetical protein
MQYYDLIAQEAIWIGCLSQLFGNYEEEEAASAPV